MRPVSIGIPRYFLRLFLLLLKKKIRLHVSSLFNSSFIFKIFLTITSMQVFKKCVISAILQRVFFSHCNATVGNDYRPNVYIFYGRPSTFLDFVSSFILLAPLILFLYLKKFLFLPNAGLHPSTYAFH